ncbi:hypothetical protein IAE37_000852 [Pseudomonas sp. S31]|uniref:hypothetical protein n=1 Tax=Pseudomonas sp. S31 TaxID=1564473 RepID=UPI001913B246|nr:hypothetical protein [Pseudomonas sp. S31]MBK4998576.1 hypothetical protein [Pseudomonas sp. S31]
MLILGEIQLRGFFSIQTELAEKTLNFRHPYDIDSKRSMRHAWRMFDAYMTLTGFHPHAMCLDDHAGFRGFLCKALQLTEDNAKSFTWQLLQDFVLVCFLEEKEANLFLSMPQAECNEIYQEREPTKCRFLHYQSLFPTSDSNGFMYVDFGSIMHLLSNAFFHCLGRLLTEYLAPLPTVQAEIDAPLIIAIAQGLLYDHPGVDFCKIHLNATDSADFIGNVRAHAEWRMHNAGFFRGDVAMNWKYLSAVLMNFFVANNICCLNKAGRRMLAPY